MIYSTGGRIFVSTSCLKGTRHLAEILEVYADPSIDDHIELVSCIEYLEDIKDALNRAVHYEPSIAPR